jgi:hypothetical protein
MHRSLVALALGLASGCVIDNSLQSNRIETIAVTVGDFDDVAAPLKRLDVAHEWFDGIISANTWDPDYDPISAQTTVEGLFGDLNNMVVFDSIFVASGTRGLGKRVYNGLDADDNLLTDDEVMGNVRRYVERGHTLFITDWAYDVIEVGWPDKIEWINDDTVPDDAQRGKIGDRIGVVEARVTDDGLRGRLEQDKIGITFDFSNWSVIESVADDVTVYLRSDIQYKPTPDADYTSQDDTPILVSFNVGQGKVVYSSFHVDAQNPNLIDPILETAVGDLDEGSASTSSTIEE